MPIALASNEAAAAPCVTEALGTVYAFLPAHGESLAGTVVKKLCRSLSVNLGLSVLLTDFCSRGFPVWGTGEAPQRLDRRSWGAFLMPGTPFDTLETREAHPREIPRLLDHAREHYGVTCADLTDAKQTASLEMLRNSDWIFVVSGSDRASLDMARFRAEWLRSIDMEEKTGLLIYRVEGGVAVAEAEDLTGLPVCAVVDREEELERLAVWLGTARA